MIPPKTSTDVTSEELDIEHDRQPSATPRRRERGAVALEYGVMAMLCSIALVGGASVIGPRVAAMFAIPGFPTP